MATIVLYHCDAKPVEDVIEGRLYTIAPKKPTEFDERIGRLILKHKAYHGIVEVAALRTEDGVRYDVAAAQLAAAKALDDADREALDLWVRGQLEERVRRNFPALPPEGRVRDIVERRGVDLAAMGIRPVGMLPASGAGGGAELEALRAENAELRRQVQAILDRLQPASPAGDAPPLPLEGARGGKAK